MQRARTAKANNNAVDVGITQDGYEILHNTHAEDIRQTDLYGDSLIDSVV
jgi:hypothetical protein